MYILKRRKHDDSMQHDHTQSHNAHNHTRIVHAVLSSIDNVFPFDCAHCVLKTTFKWSHLGVHRAIILALILLALITTMLCRSDHNKETGLYATSTGDIAGLDTTKYMKVIHHQQRIQVIYRS